MPPSNENPTPTPNTGPAPPQPAPQAQPVQPMPAPQPAMAPLPPNPPIPGPQPPGVGTMPPPVSQTSNKKLKGKVIKIIIGVVVLMVVGIIAAVFLLANAKKISESDLITYSGETATFKYPKQWLKADSDPDITVGFSNDNKDIKKASASISYVTSSLGIPASQQVAESDKIEIQNQLDIAFQDDNYKSDIKKEAECSDEGTLITEKFKNNEIIGLKVILKCKNKQGSKVTREARFGLGSDNNMHALGVTAIDSVWSLNNSVFQTMLDSLDVK